MGNIRLFVIRKLVAKDFKVRYRNMSLGAFWSLLNPLVMMGVLTFVFSKIFVNDIPHFPVFVLCGLVPYNFFSIAWANGTSSLVDNAGLIKHVPVPREIVPITSVLSNCVHLLIQIALLLSFVLAARLHPNIHWLWLPVVWGLEILFLCGLALIFSGLNVYLRDTRYLVESGNIVMFWLVPIFYDPKIIPLQYKEIYQWNPLAAVVWALRYILMDAKAPPATLLLKLTFGSVLLFLAGLAIFGRMKRRFYDYL